MAATLYMHLSPDLQQVDWQLQQGLELSQGRCSLNELIEQPQFSDCNAYLWWPGQSASLLPVRIPQAQSRQLNRILPFALEEYLASDLEQVHYVPASRLEQGELWVQVVDKKQFENLLESFAPLNLRWQQIELDLCALARIASPQLYVQGQQAYLLHPELRSCGDLDTQMMLMAQLSASEQSWRLQADHSLSAELLAELDQMAIVYEQQEVQGLLSLLRQHAKSSVGNLLTGAYGQQQHQSIWSQLPIKALSGACALLLAVFSLWSLATSMQLQQQARAYEQATQVLFEQLFPDTRFVRARFRQDLENMLRQAGQGGNSGFLPLLALASEQLPLTEGQIESIRYSDQRDELSISLRSQNIAALEQAQQGLQMRGIEVEFSLVQDQQSSIGSYIIRGDR